MGRRRSGRPAGRWARIGFLGAAATALFLTFPAVSAPADICEDPSAPGEWIECPSPPPVTTPPLTAPPQPPATSPPATSPATTPTTVRAQSGPPPVVVTTPRNTTPRNPTTRNSTTATAPAATPAPTVAPPAATDTTVAPAPPPTEPAPVTTDAPTTTAAHLEVQLASGTSTSNDLESGPTLLPTLALVALGALLFAAGYWFYVTVLGRR